MGVPLGRLAGEVFGWRGTFLWAGMIALAAAAIVGMVLPRVVPGHPVAFRPGVVLRAPGLATSPTLTLTGFAATFCVTAYLGPLLGALLGLVGVGAMAGVVLGGRWADRSSAWAPLLTSFLLAAAMLSLFGLLLLLPAGPGA
jgi:predicted MFS family arabinose efflux permease